MSSKGDQRFSGRKSSPTHELLHGLREQAAWKPGQVGYGRGEFCAYHFWWTFGSNPVNVCLLLIAVAFWFPWYVVH